MHTNIQRIGFSKIEFLYIYIYMHTLVPIFIHIAPARSFKKRIPIHIGICIYVYTNMCKHIGIDTYTNIYAYNTQPASRWEFQEIEFLCSYTNAYTYTYTYKDAPTYT